MANRFYTNFVLAPGQVILQGPEAHHLATVRRFHIGDQVVLFNGNGYEYPSEIVAIDKKTVAVNVLAEERADRELPMRLVVACALPKGDRADLLVEKLTELGVSELIPLQTERSIVKPHEAKLERFERAVIEASKQCGRNTLMRIESLSPWREFCRRGELGFKKYIADPNSHHPLSPRREDVCIAIGPEGGFTEAEIAEGCDAGWETVALGRRTLRVETAAIAVAALFALGF